MTEDDVSTTANTSKSRCVMNNGLPGAGKPASIFNDYAADASQIVDLGNLHDKVKSWFLRTELDTLMGEPQGHAEEVARDWLAVGGRRWRPFLAVSVFVALQPDEDVQTASMIQKIAVAVECFHKASLVHDDIEDGDLERYGKPTLCGEYGVPIALNVGDVLIGEGYRLLADSGLDGERVRAAVAEASGAQRLLCRGQGAELSWSHKPCSLSSHHVLEIFRLKTAPAFDVALQLGAIAAGRAHDFSDVLRAYSDAVGVAYQIKDDLDDLVDDSGLMRDATSRPSVVISLAAERAQGDDRTMLVGLATGKANADITAHHVRAAIRVSKADAEAVLLLEHYKEQAIRALDELNDQTLKGLLGHSVARILNELASEAMVESKNEGTGSEASH